MTDLDLPMFDVSGRPDPALLGTTYDTTARSAAQGGLPPKRFWSRVEMTPDCWLWTGAVNNNGYGYFGVFGRRMLVHRYAYETYVAAIPDGLEIDHLCRTRNCVRPDHLEAVDRGTNIARSDGPAAVNARKTLCVRGHELDAANTYVNPVNGYRNCRACKRHRRSPDYIGTLTRADASDTSRLAALRAAPRSGTQRARVLARLRDVHPAGLTDEELQQQLGMAASSERPRRVELVAGGWVEDSGERVPSSTGSASIVWRAVP